MDDLKEILKLQELEHKLIDDVIRYPYRKFPGRSIPLSLEERNHRIETIKKEVRNRVIIKYIAINEEREKVNKPPLKIPYLRKENE